jgi:hypothetical protein
MHRFIRKILMFENHQLLRWGSLGGYINISVGLIMVIGCLTTFRMVDLQLRKNEAEMADICRTERKAVARERDLERLRGLADFASRNHEKLHDADITLQRGFLEVACVFLGLAGFSYIILGFSVFRLKQLAMEAEQGCAD